MILYKDIPEGDVFIFDHCYSYPKQKTKEGHLDLRDNLQTTQGDPEWECTLLPGFKTNLMLRISELTNKERSLYLFERQELFALNKVKNILKDS